MEITGIIEKVLPLESGVTKTGSDWQKQNFIITNNNGYNDTKQIFCFEIFGEEKVANFNKFNKVGNNVKVDFNISTNEWKDKYFTSLQAWKVFKSEQVPDISEKAANTQFEPSPPFIEQPSEDLPF